MADRSFMSSLRSAFLIAAVGTLFGLAYTGVMEKGVFAPPPADHPVATVEEHPPEFISLEEATTFYTSGNALFVDGRHEYDYELGHIAGAVNLPLADYTEKHDVLRGVPTDKVLVTYCDGAECNSSIELAKKLSEAGFTQVKIFFGGWNEWQSHNQPTEKAGS